MQINFTMSSDEIFCMSDASLSLSITYSLCVHHELLTELNRPIKCFLHMSAISEEPVQPLTVLVRGAFLLLSALTFLQNSPYINTCIVFFLYRTYRGTMFPGTYHVPQFTANMLDVVMHWNPV